MTRLAEALKKKHGKKSRYHVAMEIWPNSKSSIGSVFNLAYIEDRQPITKKTIIDLCAWLGVDPKDYLEDYK